MKELLLKAFHQWLAHDPFTQSASASYYAVFSMPGLLISTMAIASLVFEQTTIEGEVLRRMQAVMGSDSAILVGKIVSSTQHNGQSGAAMIMGIATLLFGATGLFIHLQGALNRIWQVEVKKRSGWMTFVRNRAAAFGIMISIGFLLLISLIITTLLTALSERLSFYIPVYTVIFFHLLDFVISLGIASILFALMFKILPDIRLEWRFAIWGGIISALLFKAGEYAIGIYFDIAEPESAFGAAGSIILFMIWVFYSCLILLFGAEFTRIHAMAHRQPVHPTEIARKKREK